MRNSYKYILGLSLILGSLIPSVSAQEFQSKFSLEGQKVLEYTSPILKTEQSFTGLIIDLKQEQSPDDSLNLATRFWEEKYNRWSEWVEIASHEDHSEHTSLEHSTHSQTESILVNSNLSSRYQFKVSIKSGVDAKVPSLEIIEIESINTPENLSQLPADLLASLSSDASNSELNIISRAAWGSNEDLLFYPDTYEPEEEESLLDHGDESEEEMSEEDAEFWEKYWTDIDHVVEQEGGLYYKWPLEYMTKVRTIVIHHTASVTNLDDPKTAIRNIQYYHAVKRGWGDIGYNYVIDPQGRIYEGRRGGEMVVGGHAIPVNRTSIGISVMGNFQSQAVPKEVVESIVKLSRVKAEKYGLDLNAEMEYWEETYDVLQGHRDNSPTACPGENLYLALPSIRYLAMKGNGDTIPSLSGQKLAFLNAEPLKNITDFEAFETKNIELELINAGTETWQQANTYLELSSLDKITYSSAVNMPAKFKMQEASVAPGGTAHFTLTVEALLKAGYHGLELSVVLNSEKISDSKLFLPIYIEEADLSYTLSGSYLGKTLNLDPGEEKTLQFSLKNTGDISWNQGGLDLVLATEDGKSSQVVRSRSSVVADLSSEIVEPGDSLDFELKLKAPNTPGLSITEKYSPKIEGVDWLSLDSESLELKVKVNGDQPNVGGLNSLRREVYLLEANTASDKKIAGKIPVKNLSEMAIEVENNSGSTWNKSDLEIKLLAGKKGLGPNVFSEFRLAEEQVSNGGKGHILFKVYPRNYGAFEYSLEVGGERSEPFKILAAEKQDVLAEVVEEGIVSEVDLGPKIRVLLSYFTEDSAVVSSLGGKNIQVKVDDSLVGSSQEISLIKLDSGELEVSLGSQVYEGDKVNLLAEEDGVLEIENYEHRPSWNQDLNDNKFRSELEFRLIDGELVAINELNLEYYLYGLAEISNSALSEKIKTIVVGARSYAYHYVSDGTKFPGKPWHLDDNPDHSQKYLGYGFEIRAPKVLEAVEATRAKVVTYEDKVIKVPYFTQSDGSTRSAEEVWGWTDTPYLSAVEDIFCEETLLLGHGVGISGCGASGMAENGMDHEEIIQYFLQGVNFKYVYAWD